MNPSAPDLRAASLQEAMRWALLPIDTASEGRAVGAASTVLMNAGIEEAAHGDWVSGELTQWEVVGAPSAALSAAVVAYLQAGGDRGDVFARCYFELHARLKSEALFSHEIARSFLSHLRFVDLLARVERQSAAQIAFVLRMLDSRLPVTGDQVEIALRGLGALPEISIEDWKALFERDQLEEPLVFADATWDECADTVAASGERLGFQGDLGAVLRGIADGDDVVHPPAMQMLHFICMTAEFYDHRLDDLYEFSPRGVRGEWLLDQYPDALRSAGNAILNNAKSVKRLDRWWAWSKKQTQSASAHAVISLIEGADRIGFAARRELCAGIRRWIVRHMRLAADTHVLLPEQLTLQQLQAVMSRVASTPSGTRGIIEQRAVDFVAATTHPAPEWIARGIGDSVNASNVSRRKFGDVDLQHAVERRVVAFEPHAGTLTQMYVEHHRRSLMTVLAARVEEWERNFPDAHWDVHITFLAHAFRDIVWPSFTFGNVDVTIDGSTYDEFFGDTIQLEGAVEIAEQLLLEPLRESRTPDSVRSTFLELIAERPAAPLL